MAVCYIISERNMSKAILSYSYQRFGLIWSFTYKLSHRLSDMIRGTIMMVAWEWLITETTNDQLLGKMILAASSDQYTDTSDRQRRNCNHFITLTKDRI